MKKWLILLLLLFALLLSINVFAQQFGPPVYIANPETGECRYYFAGDERHFNPRPENFTFNIGYTTETKCEYWYLCRGLNGSNPGVGWAEGKCVCAEGFEFNESLGCIPEKPKHQILACKNTSGFWEANMPENFSCGNYCVAGWCRKVNCTWQPGCVCPQGTEWNYTLGCVYPENNSILAKIKAWFRNIGNHLIS